MNHDLLSVSEVADALGVTTRTIRNYLSDGKLKGQKIGGQWKFLKSEVYRFIGQSVENPVTNFLKTRIILKRVQYSSLIFQSLV